PGGKGYGPAGAGAASPGGTAGAGGTRGTAGGAAGDVGTRGAAGAGGAGATSPRGATGAGPTSSGGTAGARGAGGAAGAGGAGAGGTRGAGAVGHGGAGTRGAGAAGAGGAAGARGATGATGTGGAGGTTGARGQGAVGASGAAGAGGAAGAAGVGGAGAAGARGAGAIGTALHRPFFYPQPQTSLPPPDSVLHQVLSIPLLCPPTDQSQPQLLPGSPLPAPAPHTEVSESLTERCEPKTRASTPVLTRRVARPHPPAIPGTHDMALRPSSVPQCVVLLEPPTSSLPHVPDPESNLARTASPTVTRLLASVNTDLDLDTSGMGLVLGGQGSMVLTGHSVASWADDQATQCLSQGYTFSLGSIFVSWRSTRSSYVVSSSFLYVDNKAMLALCHEQRLEHRTKHISLRYFLARELQQHRQLRLSYVATQANNADVFTKALGSGDHQHFCTALGLEPTLPHLLVA
ncbi:unnamed protein product, partial [Closterium sp. NIES-54]